MSHFVIESLLKYTSSKVMSSEKFLREAMLGARTFEYTIDDFDTNFYKSVGLYSIDVKLYFDMSEVRKRIFKYNIKVTEICNNFT